MLNYHYRLNENAGMSVEPNPSFKITFTSQLGEVDLEKLERV